MSAGLPGAGIGAYLYLLLILVLPVRQLLLAPRGQRAWRSVIRQFAMITGMVVIAGIETAIAEQLGFVSASKIVRLAPALLLCATILALEILRRTVVRRDAVPRPESERLQ